jgi:putative tryptophan/tyrosine transport system substrate-binding protein
VEGRNILIEYRHSEGKPARLAALLAELVRLEVDTIVTSGPSVTRAAKDATSTIPIVFAQEGDPVGSGLVASLARPGGNMTGLSTFSQELHGKRLEILKEIVPRLACCGAWDFDRPGARTILKRPRIGHRSVAPAASIRGPTKFHGYRGCLPNR